MNIPETSRDTFCNIIWEVGTYIIYIGGIFIIEMVLKPNFGNHGMPIIAEWVFCVLELTLFVQILQKFYITADSFINTIFDSWTVKSIVREIKSIFGRLLMSQFFFPKISSSESNTDGTSDEYELIEEEKLEI